MPRYPRYRRTYFKKVYPRKKWASCMKTALVDVTINTPNTIGTNSVNICQNSSDLNVPNPVIIKFGRFKLKGDVRYSNGVARAISSCVCYVVYVPEGALLDQSLITKHPEYVLGWTCLSLDSGSSFSLSSGLKRNLNSGDKISIYFYCDVLTLPVESLTYAFYLNVQYWTSS